MNAKKIVLATAAASLFLAGPVFAEDEAAEKQVKCEGVNACQGQSACKTDASACSGKNACKGKGFLMLSEDDCEAAKADAEESEG